MADNFKVAISAIYSPNADYSDENWAIDDGDWAAYEIDPTEAYGPQKILAATGGTTLRPTDFLSTSACMLFKNFDSSNYVQVGWTDLSTTACVIRVPAGGVAVIPAINPATSVVLTANGAACYCGVAFIQNS